MASEADICNIGLGHIGESQPISALGDQSKAGKWCARLYPQLRDDLLTIRDWPFAQRVVALALSTETVPGWTYCYTKPANCLKVVSVCDVLGARAFARQVVWGEAEDTFVPAQPYRLFDSDSGTLIATDVEEAYAALTVRVTDTTRFPALFRTALGWMLGANLAGPLKVDADTALYAAKQAELWMERAAASAYNEAGQDPPAESPSIRARG